MYENLEVLKVPNALQEVTTLVMATRSCDTLARMVAIEAISSQDLQRVLDTKQFLIEVSQRLSRHENLPIVEDSRRCILKSLHVYLCNSENQAYLAYKLKIELSTESLINALTDLIYCVQPQFQCRPWQVSSWLRGGYLNMDEQRSWIWIKMTLLHKLFRSELAPPYFKSSEQVFFDALRFLMEDLPFQ